MQTFMTHEDPRAGATWLDRKRLGKQRVEGFQIAKALLTGKGWVHHSATKMWTGYEGALYCYVQAHCDEWVARGYKDTVAASMRELYLDHGFWDNGCSVVDLPDTDPDVSMYLFPDWDSLATAHAAALPWWWADVAMILTHRSSLVRKDPGHYRPLFPYISDELEYTWPKPAERDSWSLSGPGKKRVEGGELISVEEYQNGLLVSGGTPALTAALAVAEPVALEAPPVAPEPAESVAASRDPKDGSLVGGGRYVCPECGAVWTDPVTHPATPFTVTCHGDSPQGSGYTSHAPAVMDLA